MSARAGAGLAVALAVSVGAAGWLALRHLGPSAGATTRAEAQALAAALLRAKLGAPLVVALYAADGEALLRDARWTLAPDARLVSVSTYSFGWRALVIDGTGWANLFLADCAAGPGPARQAFVAVETGTAVLHAAAPGCRSAVPI